MQTRIDRRFEELARQNHDKVLAKMNDLIVRQARKFVWGVDDRQLRFVERRLGRSKMDWGIIAEAVLGVIRLRLRR